MGRKHKVYGDVERMEIAIQKLNIDPIKEEFNHNPLWFLALLVGFFVLGNLFEILWMFARDLKRLFFKVLRYPRRFVKRYVDAVKSFFIKRYGKNTRKERGLKKKW